MFVVEVVRTHLELTGPTVDSPLPPPVSGLELIHPATCGPALYRELYQRVGEGYHWTDRLDWTDAQIEQHLAREGVSVGLLRVHGEPAGWFELVRHGDGSNEIAYFGLLADHHGRGLGRYLLEAAIASARDAGAARIWLHTCTLDSPAALPNYLARGFLPFRTERYRILLGD